MRLPWTPHVVAACLAFLGGVAVASGTYAYGGWVPSFRAIAAAAIVLLAITRVAPVPWRTIVFVAIIACTIGVVRFAEIVERSHRGGIADRTALEVEGSVIRVTEYRSGWRAMRVVNATVRVRDAFAVPRDPVPVTLPRAVDIIAPSTGVAVRYGDVIRARCAFRPPERPRDRLTTSGACVLGQWNGSVRVVTTGGGSAVVRWLLQFRDGLIARVSATLAPPTAGIVAGTLLGVDRNIPESLVDAFRRTGTIHILVVSGWHMSFIGLQLRRLLVRTGMPRMLALGGALAFVVLFTIMVGLTPSAVRGALMVAAIITIEFVGRAGNPVRTLLLVGTVMVAVHPEILAFDLGFQLSFAATAGLLLLAPILSAWGARRFPVSHPWIGEVRMLVATSTAASVATAPILAGTFGTVAPLAPLVNVPVLLLIPPFMYASMALLAASVVPIVVMPIVWVVMALSTAIVWIVEHAAMLPWSQVAFARFDGWFIAGTELLLAVAVIAWYRRRGTPILSPFTRIGAEYDQLVVASNRAIGSAGRTVLP